MRAEWGTATEKPLWTQTRSGEGGTQLGSEGALWPESFSPEDKIPGSLCTSLYVCEQASVCSSVKWDSITHLLELPSVAEA